MIQRRAVYHKVHVKRVSTDIESLQAVAENIDLGKKDLRVFLFLCCRLDSQFHTKIDIKQIAKTLQISPSDVEDAIDVLLHEGIITKGSDEHVSKGYRFSYTDND